MEALELITGRRSVRQFKTEKVDRATVEKIVGAAAYAPSWKNTQVTRYYVCDDAKIKEHIARDCTMGFTYNAGTLERAPQVAVLTAVKGIGLKTAQRILVDLKNKVKNVEGLASVEVTEAPSNGAVAEEAVAALVMLGFQKAASQKAVTAILKGSPAMAVEQVIKTALRML